MRLIIHVHLKNGDFHILRDTDELKELIKEEMGEDVVDEVQKKLIDAADYADRRLETNLPLYESQLDSFKVMCRDLLDVIDDLTLTVERSKKLNRNELLDKFQKARILIENVI